MTAHQAHEAGLLARSADADVARLPRGELNYSEQIRRYDVLTPEDREAIRARIAELTSKPLIAVLMPLSRGIRPVITTRDRGDRVRPTILMIRVIGIVPGAEPVREAHAAP